MSDLAVESYVALADLFEFGDATDPMIDVHAANLAAAVAQSDSDTIIGGRAGMHESVTALMRTYGVGLILRGHLVRAYTLTPVRGLTASYMAPHEFWSLHDHLLGANTYVERANTFRQIAATATGNDPEHPYEQWRVRYEDVPALKRALREADDALRDSGVYGPPR